LASPQLEHGYARIANEILEALARADFTVYEFRIIFAILRESYGRSKKEAELSYGEMAKRTGLDRSNVYRTVKGLYRRSVVIRDNSRSVVSNDTRHQTAFIFQKDYHRWTVVKKRTVVYRDTSTVVPGDNSPYIDVKKEKERVPPSASRDAPKKREAHTSVSRLQTLFFELLAAKIGPGARFNWPAAGKEFKARLRTNDEAVIAKAIKNFFESTDPFIVNTAHSWGAFVNKFNVLIQTGGPIHGPATANRPSSHVKINAEPERAKQYAD
jgi:phage replication O-like protein O